MTRSRTVFLLLLTLVYLVFELSFNARLLDVVGSAAKLQDIHRIENYGRTLSGVAVALFVLQWFLTRKANAQLRFANFLRIAFVCVLSGGLTFFALKVLVDTLVEQRSPEFRRASLNIAILQQALADGRAELVRLSDEPAVFSSPQGKAFLALFPAMAIAVHELDKKILDAKWALVKRSVESRLGGSAAYYDQYVEAVRQVHEKYKRYSQAPTSSDADSMAQQRHEKAWGDYLAELGAKGWTPSTVPDAYRDAVRKRVRKRVPVPADWDLADEDTFRAAVERKVRQSVTAEVKFNGRKIPTGLDWNGFFMHPAIQAELRSALQLPSGVGVQPLYASGAKFEKELYQAAVHRLAKIELDRLSDPAQTYADGGANADRGLDATKSVLIPPLALLFSLIGAIGHLGKLLYLIAKLAVGPRRFLIALPFGVAGLIILALTFTHNDVTRSRLYQFLRQEVIASQSAGVRQHSAGGWLLASGMHVVAVGQGYSYPLNEALRLKVLGGFDFGYRQDAN